MIQLDNISKSFGGRTLFEGISWQLRPGRRIGFVGPNGTGKTTLFRILAGELEPDAGRVVIPTDATIGLLPQTVGEMSGGTVWERMLEAKADILALEERLDNLRNALADCRDEHELTELANELGEVEDRFLAGDGYNIRHQAQAILGGMGFTEEMMQGPVEVLSGGWRMRLVLSQLLLQRPSVLLMDEPTNHLDVPSLEWLEGFLGNYEGTVVIISHDRFFLNRLVDEIAALEFGELHVEPGNFDTYLRSREERFERLVHEKEKQDKEIERLKAFVDRFRAKATKARQAQSRQKQLDKIERIELPTERKQIHIRFPEAPRSGKEVVSCEGVRKAFGDNVVYDHLDFEVKRDERIALVGPNGQGKSTLLKMLAGVLEPDAGEVKLGHNVHIGYFAQHHIDGLDLGDTILASMERRATPESFPSCRAILGAFLFSGDDVKKKVSVLSGGEKHRVALATIMLRPTNFLLLDEPTNHLDMESRAILEEALDSYQGTVVFVSHDRTFINNVATRVVHVAGGAAVSYHGNYDFYVTARDEEKQEIAEQQSTRKAAAPVAATPVDEGLSKKEQRRLAAERRAAVNKEVGGLKKELARLEDQIASDEDEKEAVAARLADADFYMKGDPAEVSGATRRFGELGDALEKAYARWEELAAQIEEVEARFEG